jgi:hypothetical protein
MSLFKGFQLRESTRLDFRAEVYNISNAPSFANPATGFGAGNFGVISSTVGTPRQLQFALKLLF